MDTEQARWATQLREIPMPCRQALQVDEVWAIRHRRAAGEWSAIEVLGHMIDKMVHWSHRVERIACEDRPTLPGYDQDAAGREPGYQQADPAALFGPLQQPCDPFATLVAALPSSALQREGIHGQYGPYGPMTLQQCIQAPLESAAEHRQQLRTAQQVARAQRARE
jgi:hypothetical protein